MRPFHFQPRKRTNADYRGHVIGVLAILIYLAGQPLSAEGFPRPGVTEFVSEASGVPNPMSADGRYVVFARDPDLFVRDRVKGTTERVSVATDGTRANAECASAVISTDGRYVAFWTIATNLDSGDTNGTSDVYVHDRVTHETERVSLAADDSQISASFGPAISGDGRYVAFWTDWPNVVPGDTNGVWDVFVRDRVAKTTERVSVATGGGQTNSFSFGPAMSADGRYVGFMSAASNLVPNDTNGCWDTFVHDRVTGVTKRISVASDGAEGRQNNSYNPAFSADGRYAVFESGAPNLVPGATRAGDMFVHDLITGATERVSISTDGGEANGFSSGASISPDGRYVTFHSDASNLVPGDTNGATDIFVRDRVAGITERVSITSDGAEANTASYAPSISADGRHVAFLSYARLIPGGSSGVFVHDRGGSVGVLGPLSVQHLSEGVAVSGRATFSGAVISSIDDPSGDAVPGLLGPTPDTDLTGATVVYRPEQADLFVRLGGVTALPSVKHCTVNTNFVTVCEDGGGVPGAIAPGVAYRRTLYGIAFEIDGVPFEIRAWAQSTFVIEGWVNDVGVRETRTVVDPAHLSLYRCDPECTEQATLQGTRGSAGVEFAVSVPLSALGVNEGAALTSLRAFTALEETGLQARQAIDDAALPNAAVPVRSVSLGVAPRETPESEVPFNTPASLVAGNFSGNVTSPNGQTIWARACLGSVCSPATTWSPAVQLAGVASRKTHGDAGPFDVDLASGGIECRNGGANGDYTLVFTSANPLTSVADATVTSGHATINSSAIGSDSHQYIVNLTGVVNAQALTIGLTDVADSAGNFSPAMAGSMRVLVGDTNGDSLVNSSDIAQTKSQSGQSVSGSNFREDVNADGFINSADIGLAKSKSGTALP